MADKPPENAQYISVQDAVRLKHELGKSITWGNSNLNALGVQQLTKLTAEDYARIRKEYADWQGYLNLISNYVLIGIMLGCVVAYFFAPYIWLRIAVLVIGISCFYSLNKREGQAEGYIYGYEAGYEEGIYKALGIKREELAEMGQMTTDMMIDDMLVQRMNERKAAPKSGREG
jgi:hypothetical protein